MMNFFPSLASQNRHVSNSSAVAVISFKYTVLVS